MCAQRWAKRRWSTSPAAMKSGSTASGRRRKSRLREPSSFSCSRLPEYWRRRACAERGAGLLARRRRPGPGGTGRAGGRALLLLGRRWAGGAARSRRAAGAAAGGRAAGGAAAGVVGAIAAGQGGGKREGEGDGEGLFHAVGLLSKAHRDATNAPVPGP